MRNQFFCNFTSTIHNFIFSLQINKINLFARVIVFSRIIRLQFDFKYPQFDFKYPQFDFKYPQFVINYPQFDFKYPQFVINYPQFVQFFFKPLKNVIITNS